MPNLVVGTSTPVKIPTASDKDAVVQNLGVGIVYVDGSATVTTGTGIKLIVGATQTFPAGYGTLYVISDTTATNVRYVA